MADLWYPNAERKPVPSYSHLGDTPRLGLIVHVTTNWFDPYNYFSDPNNQASSDWWVRKDGHVEQYVPSDAHAWAQANGNGTYHSVETDGTPDVPLSDAQIEAIAHLYVWGHQQFGWPFQLAEAPGEPGLGWHGMGGDAWGGHVYCPGDVRKAQRGAILARAQQIISGDDMPLSADDLAKIEAIVHKQVAYALGYVEGQANSLYGGPQPVDLRALAALVQKIADKDGVS